MAVEALASERVMGELEKAIMKAARPSIFFAELKKMDRLGCWFGELGVLPDGDWRRTMEGLDRAAALRQAARQPLDFMLAAICAGFDPEGAERFLARLTSAVGTTRYVLNMVQRLRDMECCLKDDPGEGGWMAFFDASACPEDLILLAQAIRLDGTPDRTETGERLRGLYALYRDRMARPYVMGRDLVAAGLRPGPDMGRALAYAHELRLAGVEKSEQLKRTMEWIERGGAEDA